MPSAFGGQSQQRWGDNTLNQNEYLRDFLLTDLTGRVCKTADARRKGMLLLVFFRPSDPVSRQVLPFVQKIADAYKEAGKLTIWGVSQEDDATTRAAATELGIAFPLLLDRDLYHSMLYGVTAVPALFLAGGDGQIQRKAIGFRGVALNQISDKVATFAEAEPAVIDPDSPMPERPAPPPAPAEEPVAAAAAA